MPPSTNIALQPHRAMLTGDILREVFTRTAGTCSPFVIAAVCHVWRNEALDLSELWTYPVTFTIPAHDVGTPGAPELLNSMLDRCRSALLDINFRWSRNVGQGNARACVKLLQRFAVESHRWRSVRLELPGHARAHWLYMLDRPTPLLEELVVRMHPDFETTPRNQYGHTLFFLPHAPRLQLLAVEHAPELIAPRPNLTTLKLTGNIPTNHLWPTLHACAATLAHLSLDLPYVPVQTDAPSALLNLDALESLDCAGFTHHLFSSPLVQLPRAAELALLRYQDCGLFFGPHVAGRLGDRPTTLTYSPPTLKALTTRDGWTIARVRRLRRLQLMGELSRAFLIACTVPGVLPLLERLTISGWRAISKEDEIVALLWNHLEERGIYEVVLELGGQRTRVSSSSAVGIEDRIDTYLEDGENGIWSIHIAFDPNFEPKPLSW